MLFGTSTDVVNGLSTVSSSLFNDVLPYLTLVIGIILAFYVIERLIDVLWFKKENETMARADRAIAEFERLDKLTDKE